MNFPLYIAKRYAFTKNKNKAINIIAIIATCSIIFGVTVLFVFLSVFSGLKVFSLSFTNDIDPDLKISSTLGKSLFISPSQEKEINQMSKIAYYSKIVEERVLFTFNEKQEVTYLKGVDSSFCKVNDIQKKLFNGQWLETNTDQVVVGYGIAQQFSMGLLDYKNQLEVMAPRPGKGNIENPEDAFHKLALIPSGIYAISEDLDTKYVFADLGLAQELLEYQPNQISGIELKLKKDADESAIIEKLQILFDHKVTIKNRAQLNESLYKMLNTENAVLYSLCTLVIILLIFTLGGAIFMMILDKRSNLKTLYNIGAEIKDLRNIFLLQGTLITVVSAIIGLILGIAIVVAQQQYEFVMITPTLAYPVVFLFENIAIVLATILPLGFIASFIASSRVSKKLLE